MAERESSMRTEKQRHVTGGKKKTVSGSGEEDSDVERKISAFKEEEEEISPREHREEGRSQSGRDCGSSAEEGSEEDDNEDDDDEEDEDDDDDDDEEDEDDDDDDDDDEEDEDDDDKDEEDDNEEDDNDAELQAREDIRKGLSNMPFEEVMKLQQKVGTKAFNEVAFSTRRHGAVSSKKRLNKNRPMEISAKKAPSFLRQVIPIKKSTRRDPRFDSLSGEYKPEIFEKTYKFINDLKHREKEMIKKQLKKKKMGSQRKEKLQILLRRLENQEKARQTREQQRERELQFKKQQRERASRGERPFFLKKSEKKKLQLAEKYLDLKKSGKVEKFLSKKRKRNAVKDRRKLPEQLQSQKLS